MAPTADGFAARLVVLTQPRQRSTAPRRFRWSLDYHQGGRGQYLKHASAARQPASAIVFSFRPVRLRTFSQLVTIARPFRWKISRSSIHRRPLQAAMCSRSWPIQPSCQHCCSSGPVGPLVRGVRRGPQAALYARPVGGTSCASVGRHVFALLAWTTIVSCRSMQPPTPTSAQLHRIRSGPPCAGRPTHIKPTLSPYAFRGPTAGAGPRPTSPGRFVGPSVAYPASGAPFSRRTRSAPTHKPMLCRRTPLGSYADAHVDNFREPFRLPDE